MHERPEVTPDSFQILVLRELRKWGLEVGEPRTRRRTELPEPEQGFLLELRVGLKRGEWRRHALIACRRQQSAIGREAVESLAGRLTEADADVGLLFATADFGPESLGAAEERGIALLRLVDARAAFDAGGWGPPGHYPSWLPGYLVQLADRDDAGQVRYRLLESGQADVVLERLRPRAEAPPGEGGVS